MEITGKNSCSDLQVPRSQQRRGFKESSINSLQWPGELLEGMRNGKDYAHTRDSGVLLAQEVGKLKRPCSQRVIARRLCLHCHQTALSIAHFQNAARLTSSICVDLAGAIPSSRHHSASLTLPAGARFHHSLAPMHRRIYNAALVGVLDVL